MPEAVKIGIVGAGAIAQLAHLPALSKLRNAEVVGLCDNDSAKARALADRIGIPYVFTDLEDMLELDMDAVIMTTPNHLHEPHVLSALRAGVHVLCERPLSLNSGGIERILQAAERSDKKVVVGTNHRFRSDVQQLSRFLQGGELGRLQGVRAGQYHLTAQREGWRQRKAEAGGGAFFEHGYPLLDLALWLSNFPPPLRVTAHMEGPNTPGSVENSMTAYLECEGGISFVLDVNWCYVGEEERWWFEIISSRGSARLAPLRVVKELNGKPTNVSPTGAAARESVFLQSYRAELAHFIALVREEIPYDPPADQIEVMRIVEAVYKSAEERREIRFGN